ncbi:hypothetical protein [Halobaculum sp. P14]|uniref:hypothetical protein n=1 Tax=Halobaculum sp. P14 TaxID=3421638 RepID=UPI003EB9A374
MTTDSPASSEDAADEFEEHRVRRSDERVLSLSLGDVARVDERLGDLVGRAGT